MVVMDSGNVILVSDLQHQKTLFPMAVMDSDKVMLVSDGQSLKA